MYADDLANCEAYAAHKGPPPRRSAIRNILDRARAQEDLAASYAAAVANLHERHETFEQAHHEQRMDLAKSRAANVRLRQQIQQLEAQRQESDTRAAKSTSAHPHLDWAFEIVLLVSLCTLCAAAGYVIHAPSPWLVA